jgi:uncharacterized protein
MTVEAVATLQAAARKGLLAVSTPTYPGVYVTELPSSLHPITGVATSIAAFVGSATQGPVNSPQQLNNWGDFQRIFGGLASSSAMSYAVLQFFQNLGSQAYAVRIVSSTATTATIDLGNGVILDAISPGAWPNPSGPNAKSLEATVDYNTSDPSDTTLWNLTIVNSAPGGPPLEKYLNISTDTTSSSALSVVLQNSSLVQVDSASVLDVRPPAGSVDATGGDDGGTINDSDIVGSQAAHTGMYALYNTDIFNILCIPSPPSLVPETPDLADSTFTAAVDLCAERRAMFIVDPPSAPPNGPWTTVAEAQQGMTSNPPISPSSAAASNAAIYFPRIVEQDPVTGTQTTYSAAGAVAGVWAATDASRGVWKAPAGTSAGLAGGATPAVPMTDAENGDLNPLGLNCLRSFPVIGSVVWGARTLVGADVLASQWKYIPVRRLALFIEESLRRGTQWVVFEPNAEPLWASIRLNVGAFMAGLYRQGAFAGNTPDQAYLVKCDSENNPPSQVDLGIVNILVGFAPLYPAEFVIISIEQLQLTGPS